MGQGDVPASRGGPLRRRREKRQLERLAGETKREPSPLAGRAHFSVIEEPDAKVSDRTAQGVTPEHPDEPLKEGHPGGFHVHAVPIDQPFEEE